MLTIDKRVAVLAIEDLDQGFNQNFIFRGFDLFAGRCRHRWRQFAEAALAIGAFAESFESIRLPVCDRIADANQAKSGDKKPNWLSKGGKPGEDKEHIRGRPSPKKSQNETILVKRM